MKTWKNAELVELDLNQTAGGGLDITWHDNVIEWVDDPDYPGDPRHAHPEEQYQYVSGQTSGRH